MATATDTTLKAGSTGRIPQEARMGAEYCVAEIVGLFDRQGCSLDGERIRCRVTRRESGCVWVTTADLRNAGESVVLPEERVHAEPTAAGGLIHREGLVALA